MRRPGRSRQNSSGYQKCYLTKVDFDAILIYPKLGLSNKKRVPIFYLDKRTKNTFTPLSAFRIFIHSRGWSLKRVDGYSIITHKNVALKLTAQKAVTMLWEWSKWKRDYLPPFSLAGKTVLDVGAGSGETAYLFVLAGAKEIVCIEPSPEEAALIEENSTNFGWETKVIREPFKLEHLAIRKFDLVKLDCEGCESILLSLPEILVPMVVESHSGSITEGLEKKGFKRAGRQAQDPNIEIMNNFEALATSSAQERGR
jgi:SAM-dependent methyltransferase